MSGADDANFDQGEPVLGAKLPFAGFAWPGLNFHLQLAGQKLNRLPFLARLYGPAARCKPKVMIWRSWSCASVSGPLMEY